MGYDGESVMVAFQLRYGLSVYADIARRLGLTEEANWADARRAPLEAAIETASWDGEWYLWAIGADGHRYGSKSEPEGSIYINTQVWAVISGAASQTKGESAMNALNERLATPYGIMLSAPPFTNTPPAVMGGVIYNHGIKENAGIFCHTQGWAVMAEARLGRGDRAYAPCNRNGGKSRVPWLSGTAAWSHHAALQWILGIRPELDGLRIDPCIPKGWTGFSMRRTFRGNTLNIEVNNPKGVHRGVREMLVDGRRIEGNLLPLSELRDGQHVVIELG
jgi:cellobiose phosphorylase